METLTPERVPERHDSRTVQHVGHTVERTPPVA